MMNCHITGVIIKHDNAYLLDIIEAKRSVIELKNKINSINRLVEQFKDLDAVEVEDWKTGNIEIRRYHRLVCKTIAEVFNKTCSANKLFITLDEFKKKKEIRNRWKGGGENVEQ